MSYAKLPLLNKPRPVLLSPTLSYTRLHLYTLTSRVRFVMLHYRAPKSSLPALSDERQDIDAIQTRFGLWMAETKRKALQYLPEDDVENRTSIEKLAAPLDRERIRDFMSRTRTFELMTPTEAQDFVSLHTVGGKRSGSRAVLSDSDDDDDDEEVLDVGPDDYEEALGDALGGRGSKGVAAVKKSSALVRKDGGKNIASGAASSSNIKPKSGGAASKPSAPAVKTKQAPKQIKPLRPGQVRKAKKGQTLF